MSKDRFEDLRRKAEEKLAEKEGRIENLERADLESLAHELAVHQVELEIQNEELRRTRLEAEEARDRYLDLFDYAPVGYFTLDEHNRIVEANIAGCQLLEIDRKKLLKKSFTKFIDDTASDEFYIHKRKVLESENRHTLELKMQKADGIPFDAQLISVKAGPGRLRIAVSDITERKVVERELNKLKEQLEELVLERTAELRNSEQNFRNSIENSPLGIRIVTAKGRTIYANLSLLNMYGYSTLDELKNIPATERYTSESYTEHLERKRKRKQGKSLPDNYEISIVSKDGHVRHLKVHRSEVFWNGRTEFQCIYDDITERRQSLEKLEALSRRLLEVQEEERRNVALELHDEIGQSLNALKLLLSRQIILAEGEPRAALVNLSNLTGEIVQQVRQFCLDLRPSMLDDLGLLSALVWYFRRYTERTEIKIDFKHSGLDRIFSPNINSQVYRVVQEAMTNISRHAAVDSVLVQANVDREILRLKIEDKGNGFDMAKLPISSSTGLEGMCERARLLGGSLTIDSSPGQGTRLVLEIPVQGQFRRTNGQ